MHLAFRYIHIGSSVRNLALFVRNAKRTVRFCVRSDGIMFYGAGECMHGHLVALAQDYANNRLPIVHGEAGIDENTKRLAFWLTLGEEFPQARQTKDKLKRAGFGHHVNLREIDLHQRPVFSPDHVGVRQVLRERGVTGETRTPKAAGSEPVSYAKFRTRPR